MPNVIIVAGPNGAGKTSFANAFLPVQGSQYRFINADEIERSLRLGQSAPVHSEIQAARLMLSQIAVSIARRENIVIETTLATRIYATKIVNWKQQNYSVAIVYLRLKKVEDSLARVAKRVAAGGHDVPEMVVRRRFSKSREYFDSIYKHIVDEWYVWESIEGDFVPAEAWDIT